MRSSNSGLAIADAFQTQTLCDQDHQAARGGKEFYSPFVSPRPVNVMGAMSKTRCAKILNRELAEQV